MHDRQDDRGQLILIPERCIHCRKPIEVTSPTWYQLHFDYSSKRIRWRYEPDETALCVSCTIASTDEQEREKWQTKLGQLLHRKSLTGLPDGATMFHHRTNNNHVHKQVNGTFQMDQYFVHYRGSLPEGCPIPRIPVPTGQPGNPPSLLYVGWDFELEGVPATARFTWNVMDLTREGELKFDGWSAITHSDFSRLMVGVRTLLEQVETGRPEGRTYSRDDILNGYGEYYRANGWYPNQVQLADEIGTTTVTIRRVLGDGGEDWKTFDRKARQVTRSRTVRVRPR